MDTTYYVLNIFNRLFFFFKSSLSSEYLSQVIRGERMEGLECQVTIYKFCHQQLSELG